LQDKPPGPPNMHIVYLIHQFLPKHIGGVEVYTHGIAKRAASAGHQVTIVTYHESESGEISSFGAQSKTYDGLPVIEIHYNLSTASRPMRYEYNNLFTAGTLKGVLLELKPDLAHVMHAMKLSASALQVCHALGIPFIVSLGDFWFICPRHTLLKWDGSLCDGPAHRFYCARCVQDLHGFARFPHLIRDLSDLAERNRFIRELLLKARRIIALSEFQRQMYVRNGFPAQRVDVVKHGLDLPEVQYKMRVPEKPFRVGYIGSLVVHKGVHLLLEAFANINHADAVCKVYGALHDSPYVRRLRQTAGANKAIQFMGTFEPSELRKVMGGIDILAVPSVWYENEPLVVKSALQAGVPVLCNNIGSLSDMITHGVTGWLVAERTTEAWTKALKNAVEQLPDFRMRPVRMKTLDENAEELLAIYKEVGS